MAIRSFSRCTAVWPSGSPTSSALPIPFGHMAAVELHISGAWTDAQIGLQRYVFDQWQPIMDANAQWTGMNLPSASGNCSFACPINWFNSCGQDGEVKLWSNNGTGSGIAQAAARTVVLDFKS